MISDMTSLTGYDASDYKTEGTSKSLGQDEFLELFMAQLQYQDPLDPLDNAEYTSQLAQFSSLEQLFNINESIESLTTAQNGSNQFQALELIGKSVEAEGNIIAPREDELSQGGFTLSDEADCTVYIKDVNGYIIRELDLKNMSAGQNSFNWDGRDADGNIADDEFYMFEIEAVMDSGAYATVGTYIKGEIDRVNMEGDEPVVMIGDLALNLSQIVDISLQDEE